MNTTQSYTDFANDAMTPAQAASYRSCVTSERVAQLCLEDYYELSPDTGVTELGRPSIAWYNGLRKEIETEFAERGFEKWEATYVMRLLSFHVLVWNTLGIDYPPILYSASAIKYS